MEATISWLFALTLLASASTFAAGGHASEAPHGHGKVHASAVHGHSAPAATAAEGHGHDAKPAHATVSRTLTVRMDDTMRFIPSVIDVKQGETIRFVLKNDGQLVHELVLGDPAYLKELAAVVRKDPAAHHGGANMIHIPAGETGELVWTFEKAGTVDFACLLPGHFEAGMTGEVHIK